MAKNKQAVKTEAPSTTPEAQKPEVKKEPKVRVVTAKKAAGFEYAGGIADQKYTLNGGTKYNPRVHHTVEAWEKLQKAMGAKGEATHKELCDALSQHFKHTEENHHDFIGYMVRRKAINVIKK